MARIMVFVFAVAVLCVGTNATFDKFSKMFFDKFGIKQVFEKISLAPYNLFALKMGLPTYSSEYELINGITDSVLRTTAMMAALSGAASNQMDVIGSVSNDLNQFITNAQKLWGAVVQNPALNSAIAQGGGQFGSIIAGMLSGLGQTNTNAADPISNIFTAFEKGISGTQNSGASSAATTKAGYINQIAR